MFNVLYSNQALNFLKKAENIMSRRLLQKIEELRMDPFTRETKMVEGYREKIFRVGDYRILYEVDHAKNIIGIVKIDKRPKAY